QRCGNRKAAWHNAGHNRSQPIPVASPSSKVDACFSRRRIMNDRKKEIREKVEQGLAWFNSPPAPEMELAQERMLQRFRAEHVDEKIARRAEPVRPRQRWLAPLVIAGATAIVLVVLFNTRGLRPFTENPDVNAKVEAADNGLSWSRSGEALKAGE